MRQIHVATAHRRTARPDLGPGDRRRRTGHRTAPRHRTDVPAPRLAALAIRAAQRDAAGGDIRLAPQGAPRARRTPVAHGGAERIPEAPAARAVRRDAATGRAVPGADPAAPAATDGRAVLGAGRAA